MQLTSTRLRQWAWDSLLHSRHLLAAEPFNTDFSSAELSSSGRMHQASTQSMYVFLPPMNYTISGTSTLSGISTLFRTLLILLVLFADRFQEHRHHRHINIAFHHRNFRHYQNHLHS